MTTIEFTAAVAHIHTGLKPAAFKFTRDNEAAKDLIQDTMLKVLKNRDKFRAGTNLKGWIYTIMRNTFITKYHRESKRKTLVDTTDNLHYINSSTLTVHNEGASQLVIEEIEAAIAELKDTYRVPFEMHFDGFKYYEIAEILDIPIGTVKNHIHVARKVLKHKLARYKPEGLG